MASLTVRDIPGDVLARIKVLSERERRSLNKQFLVIVEDGLRTHTAGLEQERKPGPSPQSSPPATQGRGGGTISRRLVSAP